MSDDNPELRALFDADQADREGPISLIDGDRILVRDAERRIRVAALLEDEAATRSADDFYYAAMVFQHGMTLEDIERANHLARQAMALDPSHAKARWLVAASEDRILVRRGEKQRWGTQFHVDGSHVWSISPYDESVTDEERAEWGVPPIAEAHERVRRENARR